MLKLTINRDDLISALTFSFEVTDEAWYLDTETGEILLVSDAADDDIPEDIEENPRYRYIEPLSSEESFQIMENFIATINDEKVAARLSNALEGRKPFRRFKDALLDFPVIRESWFCFQNEAHTHLAKTWCEENGIDVTWV